MTTLNANTYATLEDAAYHFLEEIDGAAARARAMDAVQADIYRQKIDEANAGGGPLLEAEAAAIGIELPALCRAVKQEHLHRQNYVHSVEVARTKAKVDVRNAATAADMHRVLHAFRDCIDMLQ